MPRIEGSAITAELVAMQSHMPIAEAQSFARTVQSGTSAPPAAARDAIQEILVSSRGSMHADQSEEIARGSAWVFPTRADKTGDIIATRLVRERTMPSETGHILRHTHARAAKAAGVDDMLASLLSDHEVAGIRGV
ncbi:MAG TPA: hypothetical protein VG963_22770 [Polyangiaceae bacterium]|nr:hypothetical protein [Polyangiaceae bacterium]